MKLNRNLVGLFLFSFLFLSFAFGVTNAYAAPLAPMDDSDFDGDNKYNPSSDQMIKEVPLDSFKAPNYYNLTTASGTTVHYFEINTTDDVFSLRFYVVEEFEKINDTLITPTEIKIDIIINGFTYDNASSQLALYTKLESDSEYQEVDETQDEQKNYSSGESGVETVSGKGYLGFFTWGETAEIDGTIKNITTSVIASDDLDDNEEKIYINYPRGTLIIHDPKLGIIQTPISQTPINAWVLPVIFIVGAIAAVGIVGIVYKYKKR